MAQVQSDWSPTLWSHFRDLLRGTQWSQAGSFMEAWRHFAPWPPNVFAFTWSALDSFGLYRFTVSPPSGEEWPPSRDWEGTVKTVADQWRSKPGMPKTIRELGEILAGEADLELARLGTGERWDVCRALLELHAMADEASAGLGKPFARSGSLQSICARGEHATRQDRKPVGGVPKCCPRFAEVSDATMWNYGTVHVATPSWPPIGSPSELAARGQCREA